MNKLFMVLAFIFGSVIVTTAYAAENSGDKDIAVDCIVHMEDGVVSCKE
ncbi:MAG: hypothetical protein Q7U98_18980 [Methylicorpusculum sp.]|nr:hypothetical protein [Methylicorpusculum sp.]MDO8846341.1 hypothetical protein [Methylicorpusculum sp.]MDO8941243.1 hypothetical protein [Methylicorpusculum sp.]MDO9240877.1 hypothetical protein [Methylicorpusculum sp.]MDP2178615.1 hypothetical protein [Methylicorpusculum sp.]MDP2200723.1 hypothetical protein [Methylicorpusculum sp.]